MTKLLKAAAQLLTSHTNLKYEDIRAGNNRVILNYKLLGIYSDTNCYYRHTKIKRTNERTKDAKIKLESTIASYVAEGGVSKKGKRPVKY